MHAREISKAQAAHICTTIHTMSEKQRRQYAAREAMLIGYGGVSAIARITGLSIPTIKKGIKEIENGDLYMFNGRNRKPGGGKKKASETFRKITIEKNRAEGLQLEPDLNKAVERILIDSSYGDPSDTGRYTNITPEKVAQEINGKHESNLSITTYRRVFINLGFSLQQNVKLEQVGDPHPLRNEQFEYRKLIISQFENRGLPIISGDSKAKVKLGKFACDGREWMRIGQPRENKDHDFALRFKEIYPNGHPKLTEDFYDKSAIVTPYGVYDRQLNLGYTSLGISGDTSEFSANSIYNWWNTVGKANYQGAKELLILVDGGGSNRSRGFLWKENLAIIGHRMGLDAITVFHHPPGTSKWNYVEHRLFSMISKNWNAKSKDDLETLSGYISNTTTKTGLKVLCEIDYNVYLTEEKKKKLLLEQGINPNTVGTPESRFHQIAHLEFAHDNPIMRQWNYRIVMDRN
jgi:hypothetical protein